MVNPIHVLHCFPSGLTVAAARIEAKKMLATGQSDTLVAALNRIAQREMGMGWSDALNKLSQQHAQYDIDTSGKGNDMLAAKQLLTDANELLAQQQANAAEEATQHTNTTSDEQRSADANARYQEQLQPKVTMHVLLTGIAEIMQAHPDVGYEGLLLAGSKQSIQAQKDRLMMSVNEVNIAYYVLSKCELTKNVNRKLGSTMLADLATQYARKKNMISATDTLHEGCLIIAAHALDLKLAKPKAVAQEKATERDAAQVYFNISKRSAIFKALDS